MRIFVTIPCMDEADFIPATLNDIRNQSNCPDYKVLCVVNQPESYCSSKKFHSVYRNNLRTLDYLSSQNDLDIEIIDRCTPGKAWNNKAFGVGWARKTAMDRASELAEDNDIILSLDADTRISPYYFSSISDNFIKNPDCVGLSAPYYHELTTNPLNNLAILRYEIYMRVYSLNMWRINNPYAFTAIGSGMACRAINYREVNGITPKLSGEDFYFLLKLRKKGRILTHNQEYIRPSARFSSRVFFGTGPALIKGSSGDWSSYPIYHHELFDEVAQTFATIPELFLKPEQNYPMKGFLQSIFKNSEFVLPLIKNSKSQESFVKLCHQKIDALRILQYLRHRCAERIDQDDNSFSAFLKSFYPEFFEELKSKNYQTSLLKNDIKTLDFLRNFLFARERDYQLNDWELNIN